METILLKSLANGLFAFATPKIKNFKAVRDFKDRWFKDNYHEKTILMFKAGIADAKGILELPDELIKELLEDQINRREIYRWIIQSGQEDDFNEEFFNLEPYYERYPLHSDKILPFFQLIMLKVYEYKEKNWGPEFLSILSGIDGLREEVRTGFENLDKQTTKNINQMNDSINTTLADILGPVGYDDLKKLLEEAQVVTARKKAEERLRHARTNEERLELNALIANSYLISDEGVKSIPYLYSAISFCEDSQRINRLLALINIFEEKFDVALEYIEKNIADNGYTEDNLKLLINIYLSQKQFSKCLSLIERYGNDSTLFIKAQTLIYKSQFDEALKIAEEKLKFNNSSKEWSLMKADALCLKLEQTISQNQTSFPEDVFESVKPLLETVENNNQNKRMLHRVKELYAGIYFHTKRYKEAAMFFEEVYIFSNDERKEKYFMNLIRSLYLSRDWDKSIKILEKKISESKPSDEYILILSRIYMESGKPKNGLETLNNNFSSFRENNKVYPLEYYFLKIDLLLRLLKHEDIVSFLKEVNENERVDFIDIIKGYYALLINDWDSAIELLESGEKTLNETDFIDVKLLLVKAYKERGNTNDYEKIKKIIPSIDNWNLYSSFINNYVLALYELKEYEKILFVYFNENIEKTRLSQEIVGDIYFQSEWYYEAKDFFENLYHKTEKISYLFRYADCLFRIGHSNECLNTLRLAEKKVLKEGNTANLQLLTFAYLNAMEYDKALEYAYQTFKHGEKNPNIWRFYFAQFLQITSFVNHTKNEYINAYNRVLKTFHETFPDEDKLFEEIQALDNNKLTDEFIGRLKDFQTHQKQIDEIFQQHNMPLQTLHYFNKKDPSLIWAHVANHQNLHFSVNQVGSVEEDVDGIVNVMTSKRILLDLYSLLTIDYLDLLPILENQFQIYIYQEQFSALLNEYMQLKLSRNDGYKSIHYQNDNIQYEEWKSEEVIASIEKKEELIKWINNNCRKLGKYNVNPSDKIDFLYDDRIQLCQNSSLTMLVDSYVIRDHAKTNYNVNTFSVIDILNYLFFINKLANTRYNQYIAKLIMIGYRYVTAKPEVFFEILNKNQFQIVNEVEWVLSYLREKKVNRDYVLTTVLEILSLIEKLPNLYLEKETIYYLCDILLGEENNMHYLQKLLEEVESKTEWNNDFSLNLLSVINEKLT